MKKAGEEEGPVEEIWGMRIWRERKAPFGHYISQALLWAELCPPQKDTLKS